MQDVRIEFTYYIPEGFPLIVPNTLNLKKLMQKKIVSELNYTTSSVSTSH